MILYGVGVYTVYYNNLIEHNVQLTGKLSVLISISEEQIQCRDTTVGSCVASQKSCIDDTYMLINGGVEVHCSSDSEIPPPTTGNIYHSS